MEQTKIRMKISISNDNENWIDITQFIKSAKLEFLPNYEELTEIYAVQDEVDYEKAQGDYDKRNIS